MDVQHLPTIRSKMVTDHYFTCVINKRDLILDLVLCTFRPCKEWDVSATDYVKKLINGREALITLKTCFWYNPFACDVV